MPTPGTPSGEDEELNMGAPLADGVDAAEGSHASHGTGSGPGAMPCIHVQRHHHANGSSYAE